MHLWKNANFWHRTSKTANQAFSTIGEANASFYDHILGIRCAFSDGNHGCVGGVAAGTFPISSGDRSGVCI